MHRKTLLKKVLLWISVCCCFAGVPALIVFHSINKYYSMSEEVLKETCKRELQKALNICTKAAAAEKFWCKKLSEKLQEFSRQRSSLEETEKWLKKTREEFNSVFEYIAWNPAGKMTHISFNSDYSESEWHEVFLELIRASSEAENYKWTRPSKANIETVRRVIGPQYVSEMIEANTNAKKYGFAWTDSSLRKPLVWASVTRKGCFLVLFPHEKFKSDITLKTVIKNLSDAKAPLFGLYRPNTRNSPIWLPRNDHSFAALFNNLKICEKNMQGFVEEKKYYLATSFLTPQLRLFAVTARKFTTSQKRLKAMLGSFILILFLLPFFSYTFNTIVGEKPGTLSIRPRLAFLFFFANAIPFLAMTIVAQEHYLQKRNTLLKDIHKRSVELLKDYDKRLESSYSAFEYETQTFFDRWVASIDTKGQLTDKNNAKVIKAARQNFVDNYFLISSSSAYVGTFAGVRKVEENLSVNEEKDEARGTRPQPTMSKNDKNNAQVFNLIGKRVMRELNGTTRSNQAATKLELLAESLLQKSFAEITHGFIKAMGGITMWGFGKVQNLTLMKFMSLSGSEMIDFMAVIIWNSKTVQDHYVENTILNINRNPVGLKVVARKELTRQYFPPDFVPNQQIITQIDQATERPSEEIETIEFNDSQYLAICFKGKFLERYKIMGLYPLDRLSRIIGRQKDDLILLGMLSILLGLLLAQILTRSFLVPLEQLQNAALAIETRDYAFRVKRTSKDEFGEIATIFNDVMVGLEELEVAKVVQESLFPENHLNKNKVKIFGRSITMAELGGDYFDFFEIDNNSCGVLMGDVAGHGVGAALIMAMAKSGILSCQNCLKTPKLLLEKLHYLIHSSKTRKQKKIMTFQYLYIDTDCGLARYSNAGACSPILIENQGQTARELYLAGPALGAFKKANFKECEMQFKSGDALVFYTDGIIEARDSSGQEMGYANFMKLTQNCYDSDPEIMYQKIYRAYLKHIDGQEADDDLTLIVLVFS